MVLTRPRVILRGSETALHFFLTNVVFAIFKSSTASVHYQLSVLFSGYFSWSTE